MATDIATSARADGARKRKRAVRLSTGDRIAMAVMVGIPVIVTGGLIWFPTISSIGLSFTNWDGIGGLHTIHWTGTTNYRQIATIYPPFWPAFRHNLYWLGALAFVGTPFGMFLAYQLDKQIRGSRIYQSILYIPVVIAPAIIGLITELILSPQQGLVSSLFADPRHGHVIDWLGNPSRQPLGRAPLRLLAARELRDDPLPGRIEGARSHAPRGGGDRRRERGRARSSGSSCRR